MREMIKMVVVLTVITAVSGGVLSALKSGTEERIEGQVLKFQKAPAIAAIFDTESDEPLKNRFKIKDGEEDVTFFPFVFDDGAQAVALEAKGGGFGGDVGLMVGIDIKTDKIIRARVTTHSETPGIGSRVKDEPAVFLSQLEGMGFQSNFKVKNDGGDIDALSGATVTSRGVSAAAEQVKKLYLKLKPEIVNKMN